MNEYITKKIPRSEIKRFTISLGLLPGYDESNNEYTIESVIDIFKSWNQKRLKEEKYIFPVKATPCYFMYAFRENNKIINNSENAIEIQAEISKKFCPDFNNNQKLLNTIFEFASLLGNELDQKRIHINFNNEKYILETKK